MRETPSVTSVFPERLLRTRLYEQVAEQITTWVAANGLTAGDKLPPERELASRLGVSRATLSQALVALEVIGVVAVRHGDGTVLKEPPGVGADRRRDPRARRPAARDDRDPRRAGDQDRRPGRRTPDRRRPGPDRRRAAPPWSATSTRAVAGVEGDERFHGAVTAAAHSLLLARLMDEIGDLIKESRLESLSQPGRPRDSLAGHRAIAEAIRAGDSEAAASAMHAHVEMVSDVALLREPE